MISEVFDTGVENTTFIYGHTLVNENTFNNLFLINVNISTPILNIIKNSTYRNSKFCIKWSMSILSSRTKSPTPTSFCVAIIVDRTAVSGANYCEKHIKIALNSRRNHQHETTVKHLNKQRVKCKYKHAEMTMSSTVLRYDGNELCCVNGVTTR